LRPGLASLPPRFGFREPGICPRPRRPGATATGSVDNQGWRRRGASRKRPGRRHVLGVRAIGLSHARRVPVAGLRDERGGDRDSIVSHEEGASGEIDTVVSPILTVSPEVPCGRRPVSPRRGQPPSRQAGINRPYLAKTTPTASIPAWPLPGRHGPRSTAAATRGRPGTGGKRARPQGGPARRQGGPARRQGGPARRQGGAGPLAPPAQPRNRRFRWSRSVSPHTG
jgi:hypothetical protein